MEFRKVKKELQIEEVEKLVKAANNIKDVISENEFSEDEDGFELAKIITINLAKGGGLFRILDILSIYFEAFLNGCEMLVAFFLGIISNYIINVQLNILNKDIKCVIVSLIIISCACTIVEKLIRAKNNTVFIIENMTFGQYKALLNTNIKKITYDRNENKKNKRYIENRVVIFLKQHLFKREKIINMMLSCTSILYSALLFVGSAIAINYQFVIVIIVGLIIAFLEFFKYYPYDFRKNSVLSIFKEIKKSIRESCELLLVPSITVFVSIILLKLFNRTPDDISDTLKNMAEQIVGSWCAVFMILVYFVILIVIFSVGMLAYYKISSKINKNK